MYKELSPQSRHYVLELLEEADPLAEGLDGGAVLAEEVEDLPKSKLVSLFILITGFATHLVECLGTDADAGVPGGRFQQESGKDLGCLQPVRPAHHQQVA